MYVVGTAGHVDHGKSTLVHALTGIDPDRLAEEKERGMTIDLGFAWLTLPSGREISIVDVPGHERFIKNMLAGVGGIDLALLVIAADEGVMPQTEEHLSILELLRVKHAIVALTKVDLVDPEWLALVREDVSARLGASTLAGAPIMPVSAVTGAGLPPLLATLDTALANTQPREDFGRPRLPIDRVFTVAGFGTVVTGTLIGGQLRVGQEVEVVPGDIRTRVRGLQMHKRKSDVAQPGNRVAVNLATLATTDLVRGQVVTALGWLRPTQVLDVAIRTLPKARPLTHNAVATFHTGSAETVARVQLLDVDEVRPGEHCWAQLRLDDPVAVAKGDLFVLRSSDETIGGGEVVDVQPPRHRRKHAPVLDALRLLQRGTPEELVAQAIGRDLLAPAAIVQRSGLPADQVGAALANLRATDAAVELGGHYATRVGWNRLIGNVTDTLNTYHHHYPLRATMPREELKSRLGMQSRLFGQLLDRLTAEGLVIQTETSVRATGHEVRFSPAQERQVQSLLAALGSDPHSPPALTDLVDQLGLDAELIAALVERRAIVRLNESVAYLAATYDELTRRVVERIRESGAVTIAEVRDLTGTSRKYSLALMEHLDEQKVTRRVGDTRVLR